MIESSVRTRLSLLARLRDYRDSEAWGEFLDRYGPLILAWCRRWRLQPADADEVAGMVLLKLSQRMARFEYDPARRFRGWLRTVVDSQVADLLRAARRPAEGTDRLADCPGPEAEPLEDDLRRELEELLSPAVAAALEAVRGRVEPRTWEAFRLTVLEGARGVEAAARLQMPLNSVHQAKGRVARLVREEVARRLAPGVRADVMN